ALCTGRDFGRHLPRGRPRGPPGSGPAPHRAAQALRGAEEGAHRAKLTSGDRRATVPVSLGEGTSGPGDPTKLRSRDGSHAARVRWRVADRRRAGLGKPTGARDPRLVMVTVENRTLENRQDSVQ